MRRPHFPVDMNDLPSHLAFDDMRDKTRMQIGEVSVSIAKANHPDAVYAFRLEHEGRSIVYATDTEHYSCVDQRLVTLARDADVLIYDAQYLPEEYAGKAGPTRVGWGHSTWEAGAELARAAGVGKLVLFHHDPMRSDEGVAAIEADPRRVQGECRRPRGNGDRGRRRLRERRPGCVIALSRVHERDHKLSLLLDLGAMLAREVELDTLLGALGARIAGAMRAERATIYLVDSATGDLRSRIADQTDEIRLPRGKGIAGHVAETGEVINVADAARDPRHFGEVDRNYITRTILAAPIRDGRVSRGVVQVLNKLEGAFTEEDEAFLHALAAQVAQALEGTTLRPVDRNDPGVAVRGPINHIAGASAPMRAVYALVQRAAATDATVLLRGETGVGKGLFARAIHANCKRSDGPMITVDCTTLPTSLVESELFGHERGAYTGADRRVQGKVELAIGGTLFLDEVGDLPPPAQSKLLRFLQERTFERVGGRETLRADVRIVAATHRKLEELVERSEFREDLFYRLRVVEIEIPPLRARGPEEVETIARHFLAHYGRRHERSMRLTPASLTALRAHPWPGNVRELEHAIERAVVLAPSPEIEPEHLGLWVKARPARASGSDGSAVTLPLGLPLEEVERRYVEATLAAQGGNLTKTAEALAVGRNTLKRKVRSRDK